MKFLNWLFQKEQPAEDAGIVAIDPFDARQMICRASSTRYYGDGGTIHSSGYLDVETYRGKVVAVWFRCQTLPFKQSKVDVRRAAAMLKDYIAPEICGLELRDGETKTQE